MTDVIELVASRIEFELREDQAPGLPKRVAKAALQALADAPLNNKALGAAVVEAFKHRKLGGSAEYRVAITIYLKNVVNGEGND
jgi:hypothetical protein